jgi:purine-binding chemotaxis protein CheW
MQMPETTSEQGQYLAFAIAGEEYAVGILRVREIIEFETITRVPTTPPWIRGVINLRGAVVPVVDLAVKLGLPATALTKRTCVVIVEADLEGEGTVMGIMADSVSQVIDLAAGDIEDAPPFGTRVRVDYLRGMGRVGRKFVLILDIDRVLSANELLATAQAGAAVA